MRARPHKYQNSVTIYRLILRENALMIIPKAVASVAAYSELNMT